ncbi:hypothetical protein ACA910_014554 [Epithemia clementina (nom. ined.)]
MVPPIRLSRIHTQILQCPRCCIYAVVAAAVPRRECDDGTIDFVVELLQVRMLLLHLLVTLLDDASDCFLIATTTATTH